MLERLVDVNVAAADEAVAGLPAPDTAILSSTLIQRLWTYTLTRGGVIKNVLSFLPDGSIGNHDSPSERSWSIENGVLRLHREDGTIHVMFDSQQMQDERVVLHGQAMLDTGTVSVLLTGRPLYRPTSRTARSDLHVELSLRRPWRPLLATFNGGGTPFSDETSGFDFYRLPLSLDVDCIRFAEHERHFLRYFDKIGLIEQHLEHCLVQGHTRIVLFGFSASGYACVMLAERLAARFPELSFATVLVNAQLAVDLEAETRIAAAVPARLLPPFWGDWTPDAGEFAYLPIADLIGQYGPRENVHHVVLFDDGNPGEVLYSREVEGLPGFELRPIRLELAHADGITEMFRRGLIEQAIRDMLDP